MILSIYKRKLALFLSKEFMINDILKKDEFLKRVTDTKSGTKIFIAP